MYDCNYCGLSFKTKPMCDNHEKSQHIKEPEYTCDCGKEFFTHSHFLNHQYGCKGK